MQLDDDVAIAQTIQVLQALQEARSSQEPRSQTHESQVLSSRIKVQEDRIKSPPRAKKLERIKSIERAQQFLDEQSKPEARRTPIKVALYKGPMAKLLKTPTRKAIGDQAYIETLESRITLLEAQVNALTTQDAESKEATSRQRYR